MQQLSLTATFDKHSKRIRKAIFLAKRFALSSNRTSLKLAKQAVGRLAD